MSPGWYPADVQSAQCVSTLQTACEASADPLHPASYSGTFQILTVLVMVLAMVLLQVSLTGSVYIVLMVALERYLNICRPFRYTPQVGTYIHDICNCDC